MRFALCIALCATGAASADFRTEVAPLLTAHCLKCHSGDQPKGDLDLSRPDALRDANVRATFAEVIGERKMPPKMPLSAADSATLTAWVKAGAKWDGGNLQAPADTKRRVGRDWWSLQPIKRPTTHSSIDEFVAEKLRQNGLDFSPEADRRTLMLRVSLDLTGLRPSPEQIDEYLRDDAPDAYERLVERLLASPQYGERWGRHWLDVVRFAESHGYEMNTLRPNAWPYRDYVIRAFNRDTPFPDFIREQVAGDTVADADALTRSATGFLVAGPHDMVGNGTEEGKRQQRADDLSDVVSNTSQTFLGLTVGCAKCHDHKFDPIDQRDFYAVQGLFTGVEHADRELSGAAPGSEKFAPVEAKFVRLTIDSTGDGAEPCIDEFEVFDAAGVNVALASNGARATASSLLPGYPIHRVEHLNDGRYGNTWSWISNEPGRGWCQVEFARPTLVQRVAWGRDREGKYADRLAKAYRIEVSSDGASWTRVAASTTHDKPMTGYAGRFRSPDVSYLLKRGDVMQRAEPIAPAAVTAVTPAMSLPADAPEPERRKAFAAWLADARNPLPARVMVNRVWHWHFGQGIVRTPSDFGSMGDTPSHPELLDWMASEFLADGGRLKPLHRRIVMSRTYRQSSTLRSDAAAKDAGNRLLWRYAPRRLEAEALRDEVLRASGSLTATGGGPGYHIWDYSGYVIVFTPKPLPGADTFRRMVYQFKPRLQQDATFGAFDCPDATASTPRRSQSTTALQALNLMNSEFMRDQADRFAARLKADAGGEPRDQVRRAFRLAFGRSPSAEEEEAAAGLVRDHGAAALCRALLNANEFAFVD